MIDWTFVIIVAAIVATIMEAVKQLPFLSREWRHNWLRDLTIMASAFLVSTILAAIIGIGLGICSGMLQAFSYSLMVWCTQKAIGQEVIHKALKKKLEQA